MDNESVIKMAKAGLGDELIIETINTQPGKYVTDADSLVKLKTAGVSDRVITAMINKSRRQLTNVPEKPVELSDVNEIGVYYKDHTGKWIAIEPEIVHIKSGGWLKSTATHGIIREDRNGHLNGRESKLALQCPIEILIYVPEGVSANEYDFLRFRINSDNREFRVLTGGVFHSTGRRGSRRSEIQSRQNRAAYLPVHRRERHGRGRIRHPATRHRQCHQRRQNLHVRHCRVATPNADIFTRSAKPRPEDGLCLIAKA